MMNSNTSTWHDIFHRIRSASFYQEITWAWHVISITYEELCARLGLDRLELRRLHCDLITCFKSIHGFNCLRLEDCLLFVANKLLVVIQYKLHVQNYRIDARKYFFSSRVVTIWNQLPAEIFNVVAWRSGSVVGLDQRS